MEETRFSAVWMRGGTSKGLFIDPANLPADPVIRDKLLLAAIGSPDPFGKQIDGLGGATSSTSKIVMVNPSSREGFDVDYTFGHVAIDQPVIDYSGNCGNLSSAVGVFAIEQGMVPCSHSGMTSVRVWQANLGQKMIIHVPTSDQGQVLNHGDCSIAGVSGTGAPIKVEFIKPGLEDGTVLPTGKAQEILTLDCGQQLTVSMINAGNATVFINAKDLGLQGTELPDQINSNEALLEQVEKIRCAASVAMGLSKNIKQASQQPATPKLAFVSRSQDYKTTQGSTLKQIRMHLCARIFSMGKLHHAFTGTGAIAVAVAAQIPETLVANAIDGPMVKKNDILKIGHSAGLMECTASVDNIDLKWIANSASIIRTARSLMRGEVITPKDYLLNVY